MPTIAEATSKSLEDIGYERVENGPASSTNSGAASAPVASYLRSPTPPTGVSPDSLHLFGQNSATPQARLFSVPQLSDDTGGAATINQTINISGGSSTSGGGSSIVITQPSSANSAVTTPILNQNDVFSTTVQMAKTFVLIRVAVSSPARVQLYSTAAAQAADAGRDSSTPVALGAPTGVIADFYLATADESNWICSPSVLGTNADATRSTTIYVTVTNIVPVTTPITASFLYVPLEG